MPEPGIENEISRDRVNDRESNESNPLTREFAESFLGAHRQSNSTAPLETYVLKIGADQLSVKPGQAYDVWTNEKGEIVIGVAADHGVKRFVGIRNNDGQLQVRPFGAVGAVLHADGVKRDLGTQTATGEAVRATENAKPSADKSVWTALDPEKHQLSLFGDKNATRIGFDKSKEASVEIALKSGQRISIAPGETLPLGRNVEGKGRIHGGNTHVSREHATLLYHDDGLYVRNDDSKNGVVITRNGERLEVKDKSFVPLLEGDKVYLGSEELKVVGKGGSNVLSSLVRPRESVQQDKAELKSIEIPQIFESMVSKPKRESPMLLPKGLENIDREVITSGGVSGRLSGFSNDREIAIVRQPLASRLELPVKLFDYVLDPSGNNAILPNPQHYQRLDLSSPPLPGPDCGFYLHKSSNQVVLVEHGMFPSFEARVQKRPELVAVLNREVSVSFRDAGLAGRFVEHFDAVQALSEKANGRQLSSPDAGIAFNDICKKFLTQEGITNQRVLNTEFQFTRGTTDHTACSYWNVVDGERRRVIYDANKNVFKDKATSKPVKGDNLVKVVTIPFNSFLASPSQVMHDAFLELYSSSEQDFKSALRNGNGENVKDEVAKDRISREFLHKVQEVSREPVVDRQARRELAKGGIPDQNELVDQLKRTLNKVVDHTPSLEKTRSLLELASSEHGRRADVRKEIVSYIHSTAPGELLLGYRSAQLEGIRQQQQLESLSSDRIVSPTPSSRIDQLSKQHSQVAESSTRTSKPRLDEQVALQGKSRSGELLKKSGKAGGLLILADLVTSNLSASEQTPSRRSTATISGGTRK